MKFFYLSLLLLVSNIPIQDAWAVELEVMVLYDSDFARAKNPQTTIQSYVNTANSAYAMSDMDLSLRVVHSEQVGGLPNEAGKSVLQRIVSPYGAFAISPTIWDLQDAYRPDITVYITNASSSLCGIANFPLYSGQSLPELIRNNPRTPRQVIEKRYYDGHISDFNAVAAVGWQPGCGARTFIHEIGHVLGAGHGEVREDWDAVFGLVTGTDKWHPGKPIETAVGHGYYDIYRTIMTYPDVYGGAARVNYISNPAVYFQSLPTGLSTRNAAAGMVRIAEDKVQHNSACYPAKRIYDYRKRTVTRRCEK